LVFVGIMRVRALAQAMATCCAVRTRARLLVAVIVAAFLRLHPFDFCLGPGCCSGRAAFVGGLSVGQQRFCRPLVSAADVQTQGRHRSLTLAAASQGKNVKTGAGGKYRGVVNPRLRSLLEATEYRSIIVLLSDLKKEGYLGDFLGNADTFWKSINIFQLAVQESQGGGRGVLGTVKQDWSKIWPLALDSQRLAAFTTFSAFWTRLDRSKIIEDLMNDVLPDLEKGYKDKLESKDQQKLIQMSGDERRDEIIKRLGNCELVKQYVLLSQSDEEVKSIGGEMGPFIANFISSLERKVSLETDKLGQTVDYAVIGGVVLVIIIALAAAGVIKIPDPTF